jgi:hypothetical protein
MTMFCTNHYFPAEQFKYRAQAVGKTLMEGRYANFLFAREFDQGVEHCGAGCKYPIHITGVG